MSGWRHRCDDELEAKGLAGMLTRAGISAGTEVINGALYVVAADADAAEDFMAKFAAVHVRRIDREQSTLLARRERIGRAILCTGFAGLLAGALAHWLL